MWYPVEFFPQVPTVNGIVTPKCVAAECWMLYRECEQPALSSHGPASRQPHFTPQAHHRRR